MNSHCAGKILVPAYLTSCSSLAPIQSRPPWQTPFELLQLLSDILRHLVEGHLVSASAGTLLLTYTNLFSPLAPIGKATGSPSAIRGPKQTCASFSDKMSATCHFCPVYPSLHPFPHTDRPISFNPCTAQRCGLQKLPWLLLDGTLGKPSLRPSLYHLCLALNCGLLVHLNGIPLQSFVLIYVADAYPRVNETWPAKEVIIDSIPPLLFSARTTNWDAEDSSP
jgi:hypothetical protein